MNDSAAAAAPAASAGTTGTPAGAHVQHGEHIDTIESVNMVFAAQRRLSFTYGAIFFGGTLMIPAMSVWVPGWYGSAIWGGFTWNYLVVSIIYFVFLWVLAWTYAKRADRLDERLMDMADEITAESKGGAA